MRPEPVEGRASASSARNEPSRYRSAIECTMTGSPLRRLQELAARARVIGQRLFASDEGGESGGLPVRVQWNYGLT